jgi:5-methyltetrahydropteroyltriglutamate--homocysteine methyltransferase
MMTTATTSEGRLQTDKNSPAILTSTVGSYPWPEWLAMARTESAVTDATRIVFDTQRQAGIDLPTDGEVYRFDPSHPDTNGMIEYFVEAMGGTRAAFGRSEVQRFREKQTMGFRAKPAAIVDQPLHEGALDVLSDCQRAASVAGGPFKFTVTSPYMLARTLLDDCYGDFASLLDAVASVIAAQVADLPCHCVQIDEANIPGNPEHANMAAAAINKVLDQVSPGTERAVHLCFGNYGGQTIQQGTWQKLTDFLNSLRVDHLVLELAHRDGSDLQALKEVDPSIGLGIGVVDVKANPVESPDQIARRLEEAEQILGPGRIRFIHPDCGLWMLKRSVADRKVAALAPGRDRYLGRG